MALQSEAQQLETLLELQRDLALEANIDKVLWRITLAATFMLDADRATLFVADAEKNELWSRALTEGGESVAAIREIRLPLDGYR
jgi:6-phosphogluconolactonase/glucosamine-6-phosphate isomerase/deaminase